MFCVDVDTLEAYFAFDPKREADLRRLDALISKAAPSLKRHFHKGTPTGEPGMRFKMIGYGKSFYHATTGKKVEWPVVGVALQKNYISVYFAVTKRGAAVTDPYVGRLGECAWPQQFQFRKVRRFGFIPCSSLVQRGRASFRRRPRQCFRDNAGGEA
jgi:hypothetical protein